MVGFSVLYNRHLAVNAVSLISSCECNNVNYLFIRNLSLSTVSIQQHLSLEAVKYGLVAVRMGGGCSISDI